MEKKGTGRSAGRGRARVGDGVTLSDLIAPGGVKNRAALRARENFFEYCKYINPGFYKDGREYLKQMCDALQALIEGRLTKTGISERPRADAVKGMMINLPPRHGKSYTLTLFEQWLLGRKNDTKIITVSYNEILSTRFARGVRDGIDQSKVDPDFHTFSDAFPGVKIKYGDAAAQMWALEGQYFNFLAAGFGGTLTGVGATLGIIDDPIKNHMEAANENLLQSQWEWYTDTYLSRIEEGGYQIIVMTRWALGDLCGRIMEREGDRWYEMRMSAVADEDAHRTLCPEILSWERLMRIRKTTSEMIVRANYMQEPIDAAGRLYQGFRTYEDVPRGPDMRPVFEKIIAYCDTADTGKDYLCLWVGGIIRGQIWILDVYYTDAPMEVTEIGAADILHRNHVAIAAIESNNGGRIFARNVGERLWQRHHDRSVYILPRNQRQNKEARILTQSSYVEQNVFFPSGWERRWPEAYRALSGYQRKGKNAHDDAPDALTGLCECAQGKISTRTKRMNGKGAYK